MGQKTLLQKIERFAKDWTLLCSLIVGSVVYLLFSEIPALQPIGDFCGPRLVGLMPYIIFCILYVTFCKIQVSNLRPRTWHFILQAIRIALSGLVVLLISITVNPEAKLILEGVFICVICPTAAAAPVIVDKLGGNIESLTVYILIANCVTSIIIPLFFPMVEKGADISFLMAFLMVLRRVLTVLILPLCLALLTRKLLPAVAQFIRSKPNLAFYLWSVNLSIIMGLTMKTLLHAPVSGFVLFLMIVIPLGLTILQFSIGKAVGRHWGDSIGAGQALGQKNNVVGIWLCITFLNPLAALSPCAYVVWQNLVNALQLWYKEKYGYLKW